MATRAKKVEAAAEQQDNPMANIMTMLQGIATGMDSLNRRVNMIEQGANATDPGNPTFSQPSNRLEKRQVKEVATASVLLECYTDCRVPYICTLYKDPSAKDGIGRDFLDGKGKSGRNLRSTTWHGKAIVETKLSGNLPIGTVLETRDGYGLNWYAVTDRGAVELEGYEKAIQVL